MLLSQCDAGLACSLKARALAAGSAPGSRDHSPLLQWEVGSCTTEVFGGWRPRWWWAVGSSALPDNALCGAVQTRCPRTLLISPAAILDIPVYKSRIHSLHVLFSLFLEFKNSQVCISTQVLLTQLAALHNCSLHVWLCGAMGVYKASGPVGPRDCVLSRSSPWCLCLTQGARPCSGLRCHVVQQANTSQNAFPWDDC